MTLLPNYSIIVPVFNSEQSLNELFLGIRDVFTAMNQTFEVIFVDDGSEDRSWQVLEELKTAFSDRITAIRLAKNFGQHNATFCGFQFANGSQIITIDDDLQVPPAEIVKLIEAREQTKHDLIYGCFRKKEQSALRNAGSATVKKASRMFRGTAGEGSSFRLISRELVEKILSYNTYFVFIDEILHWYTGEITCVEVRHLPRKYKSSNYSIGMLIRMSGNSLIFYSTIPLKIMVYGGSALALVFFLFGAYYGCRKIFFSVPVPGYTSLIVAILFSTGIILLSLGVIGEYISRIYSIQNKKPLFSIKKII
ncbi:MAG: glycosyltransferase family 2 protein [Bacteroidales bacterium]|nr:glycosyltransferase family 2 protein [Bacteroidales bacterium]